MATMLKFRLKNMDCAACAAKLEHGLNKADGVEDAVVDFVNQTLFVQTGEIQHVVKTARAIDPKVELIPKSDRTIPPAAGDDIEGINFKKEVGLLVAATVLFGWLLINEHELAGASLFTWPMLIVLAAYVMAGGNVIANAFQTIRRGTLFDENVLMVIATGGAIGIQAYSEAVGVMIFFKIGELLQAGAVSRSRRSIHALLAARPDQAVVKTMQGLRTVTPESVAVGDILVVKPGQKIPLDGNVLEGQSHLDTSALTGEPVPLSVKPGDPVMAGQISTTGALTVEVTRPFRESSIARVMDLVENATARKARTEKFITTFARYYTPAVVLISRRHRLFAAPVDRRLLPDMDLSGPGPPGDFLPLCTGHQHSVGVFRRSGACLTAGHPGQGLQLYRCSGRRKNRCLRQDRDPDQRRVPG